MDESKLTGDNELKLKTSKFDSGVKLGNAQQQNIVFCGTLCMHRRTGIHENVIGVVLNTGISTVKGVNIVQRLYPR